MLPLAVSDRPEVSTDLRVTPFAVSRSYAPDDAPIDVMRELSVDWIVVGSVRVDGSQLLASVELTGRVARALAGPGRFEEAWTT